MPAIDERGRHELFLAVQDKLGPSHADTLMSLLPPVGWADVATKHDLHELEERIAMRFEQADIKTTGQFEIVHERFSRIDDRFKMVDERFKAVDQRFADIDQRLTRIDERLASNDENFASMERRLGGNDQNFARMDGRFENLDERFESLEHRILGAVHQALAEQTRALSFALVGALASMASVCLGAIVLLG